MRVERRMLSVLVASLFVVAGAISFQADAAGLTSQLPDVASGKKLCTYADGTELVVPISRACPTTSSSITGGQRRLSRQAMKSGSVGWRCWYSDGTYSETSGAPCPR